MKEKQKKTFDEMLELVVVIMLGVTALLTAWASWVGALHTPSDGRAEPLKAVPAIAAAARRAGAKVLTNCAVRGVDKAAGHVAAVVTERGRIRCSSVVMAGGAWSRLFCGNLGIDVVFVDDPNPA